MNGTLTNYEAMKKTILVKQEVDLKTLEVQVLPRCWEYTTINGESNETGELVPLRNGHSWNPSIDIDSGIIKDWPIGTKAEIHFKVCDAGSYYLKDETGKIVLSIENDYVPSIMSPKEPGYGDYIIMDIDENGQIKNWKIKLEGFLNEDED